MLTDGVKLGQAAAEIKAGRKKEARALLREVLVNDINNLTAWELLVDAAYNQDEEAYCLNRILKIRPYHPWAGERLAALNSAGQSTPAFYPESSPAAAQPKRAKEKKVKVKKEKEIKDGKKRNNRTFFLVSFAFLYLLCLGLITTTLSSIGYFYDPSGAQTSTAIAGHNLACQNLIEQAIKASGDYCNQIGAEKVCYGNITIQAELQPDANQRFSERGDTIDISLLQSLSASPLDPDNNQWGIAIFKVLANLPRSLPGQLVTMIVFGNTSLDRSGQGLESFYFSSEFGEILCEKVPYYGILVTMPDGAGVRFTVNGAELTLLGNASLRAVKNDEMVVSLYSGSGRIVSAGKEQYFGAGHEVTVQLGGPNGSDAISTPSAPMLLSSDELNLSCTMTGQACSQSDITPVSQKEAEVDVMSGLGITPTPTGTQISTRTRLSLFTPSITPRLIRTPAPPRTPTSLPNRTQPNLPTSTPHAPTAATNRPGSTSTSVPTNTPVPAPTKINAPPTDTSTPQSSLACDVSIGSLSPSSADLSVDVTNNNASGSLTIDHLEVWWVNYPTSQFLQKVLFDGSEIWSGNDRVPTTQFPEEFGWTGNASNRQIDAGSTKTLLIRFHDNQDLSVTGHPRVHVTFYPGCDLDRSYP
jgi:hypothetical protein